MTSRRSFTSKRPLSAIFLGTPSPSNSSSNIPDLPEPPSPGAASNGSGLPSPPATNSTGSGSTGDNHSANAGSTRQRPVSYSASTTTNSNTNMHDGIHDRRRGSGDDDDDDEHGVGEDDTARLVRRSLRTPSENVLALQRVKSLTQRNRMAIDKLSSFSRLSTPSPSNNASRTLRSPHPPLTSSGSSSSSSRISAHSHSRSEPRRFDPEPPQSGSETERESQRLSRNYSSDDLSTPPSTVSVAPGRPLSSLSHNPTPRQRRTSAPASPAKALKRGSASPGPSQSPRSKRVSLQVGNDGQDLTIAALAAVASSRRSPTGNGKRSRQPLPKEFRERDRRSLDGKLSGEPSTPHRDRDRNAYTGRGSPSSPKATTSTLTSNTQRSPRAPRPNRSSTVRDLTRRHQTRWLSEDLSSTFPDGEDDPGGGRRQTQRGGSGELVSAGRSLVGEGLRAAGIMKRRDAGDDVFGIGSGAGNGSGPGVEQIGAVSQRRVRSTGEWREGGVEYDGSSRSSGGQSNRVREGVGPPARAPPDPRTPAPNGEGRLNRESLSVRPQTSMAEFYHGEDGNPPRTAPPALRSHRSAYPLPERERDRENGAGSSASIRRSLQLQQNQATSHDRTCASPFNTTRRYTSMAPLPPTSSASNATPGMHQHTNSEHGRLMLEALSMFESNLSRIPPMGSTSTSTIPELFRSSQNIVHASERLNSLLRSGTNRALEQQIDAEVSDEGATGDLVDVWRQVGGEYRESLRVSDELVRTMTGFLLGVGKVLKETAAVVDGGQQHHFRSVSLDDDVTRRPSPEVGVDTGRKSDGRRSTQSRRSWEPTPRDQGDVATRRFSGRPEGVISTRPASALNQRDRDVGPDDAPLPPPHSTLSRSGTVPASGSMRRLFTPREQREQQMNASSSMESLDVSHGYEPSPTPASRSAQASAARGLAPLSIPPPLPTLPSESLLRRSSITDKNGRRKVSTTSIVTVRANPTFPAISTPNATTAITPHTVSNSPEKPTFPLLRSDSGGTSRSNVTFSLPSTISVSALNGLQQQHNRNGRKRTASSTSSTVEEPSSVPTNTMVTSPLSGSETERDTRRRTIGVRGRVSLDSALSERDLESNSQAQTVTLPSRRDRRPTVSEVFSRR